MLDVRKFATRLPAAQLAVSVRLQMVHTGPGFHTFAYVMGTRDASRGVKVARLQTWFIYPHLVMRLRTVLDTRPHQAYSNNEFHFNFINMFMYSYCCLCTCILIVRPCILILSMYSYCCLCILIVRHVFLSLSMYTYCRPCILRRGYPD